MRAMRVFTGVALVLGLAGLLACERRDSNRTSGSKSRTTSPDDRSYTTPKGATTDSSWLVMASEANLAEVDAGKLAQSKAASTEIRQFAQQMVEDHTKSNQELTDLAQKKGITLPTRADEKHRKSTADLADLSGLEFDRKYADMMVSEHEKAVALFESHSNSTDSDVKAFVDKTLPTLRHHLQMARDLKPKAD